MKRKGKTCKRARARNKIINNDDINVFNKCNKIDKNQQANKRRKNRENNVKNKK